MDLELTELNSISFPAKIYQPFCLNTSTSQAHSLLSKTEVKILNLNYKYLSDNDSMHFEMQSVEIDETAAPTEHIQKDLRKIMRQSNSEERHSLLLDSVLIPSLASNPPNVRLVQHEWSPEGVFNDKCLLVTLTNFGVATLFYHEDATDGQIVDGEKRKWSLLKNITEIWTSSAEGTCNDVEPCPSYLALKSRVDQMLIKCVCWLDRMTFNSAYIACFIEYGALVFFRISSTANNCDPNNVSVQMVGLVETGQLKHRKMKWIKSTATNSSILLCGCSNGQLVAYTVEHDVDNRIDAKYLIDKLWSEADQIQIKEILTHYYEKTQTYLVLAVKGAHILLFLLNKSGRLLTSEVFFGDHMEITGITDVMPLTYLICTLSGNLEVLKVEMDDGQLNYTTQNVKIDLDLVKWRIFGVTASKNKTFCIIATSPALPYDHLKLRNPTVLTICLSSYADPYAILRNNPTLNLTEYGDVTETIRLQFYKTKVMNENFMGSILDDIQLTDEYIYKHKLKLIVYGTLCDYYRQRSARRYNIYLNYFQSSCQLIEIYAAYKNLNFLHNYYKENNTFSKNQIASAKFLRILMKNYIQAELFEEYTTIQNSLKKKLEVIVQKTVYLEGFESENCVYCGQSIADDKFECDENHLLERCFYSQLQIPFFESHWCLKCKRQSLDVNTLQEMFKQDTISCIFCDGVLVKAKCLKSNSDSNI